MIQKILVRQTSRRLAIAIPFILLLHGCSPTKKAVATPDIAFITNGPGPFWAAAEVGLRDASLKFGVHATLSTPTSGAVAEQKRLLEDAVTRGVSGIAISAADPKNQLDMINAAA